MTIDVSALVARLADVHERERAESELAEHAASSEVLAFLRAGPTEPTTAAEDVARNAGFRDVFAAVADRLAPELAWSIASEAIGRVGDGDVGARTRFVVRRAALVRWAASAGEDALPDALGALSEDAETGLCALEAIAAHPETRRERVLAEVRPYFGHSALARHPSLAAVAIRALAPEADLGDLRLPAAIVKAWDDAAITERSIVVDLVERGLLASDTIAPGDGRRRLGRDLVLDVLTRAKVVACFDVESGLAPVPYASLITETIAPIARELAAVTVHATAEALPDAKSFAYEISASVPGVEVQTRFSDASDYYDVERIVALVSALLERAGARARCVAIATGDQSAIVMCAPPKVARAIAKKYRLRLLKAS